MRCNPSIYMEETIDISLDELDQAYGGALSALLQPAQVAKAAELERGVPIVSVLPRGPIARVARK